MVTVESLTEELEEARVIAREDRVPTAMVSATMGKAKLYGLDKQVIEHKGPDMAGILQDLIEKLPG